jgi:hypothetical protein
MRALFPGKDNPNDRNELSVSQKIKAPRSEFLKIDVNFEKLTSISEFMFGLVNLSCVDMII